MEVVVGRVGTRSTDDSVVAWAWGDVVVAVAAIDGVVPGIATQLVVAVAALQQVSLVASVEAVVAPQARESVRPVCAGELVVDRVRAHQVLPWRVADGPTIAVVAEREGTGVQRALQAHGHHGIGADADAQVQRGHPSGRHEHGLPGGQFAGCGRAGAQAGDGEGVGATRGVVELQFIGVGTEVGDGVGAVGAGEIEGEGVKAAAPHQAVVTSVTHEVVALGTAREGVIAVGAEDVHLLDVGQRVGAALAVELDAGGQRGAEVDGRGAAKAVACDVVAVAAVHGVVVGRTAAQNDVVVARAAVDRIVARAGVDEVDATQAADGFCAVGAVEVVIARSSCQQRN